MEQAPLFERLGGREGIRTVVEKALTNHLSNQVIKTRYEHAHQSKEEMVHHATEFFCTGLSGVPSYEGRPLAEAHAGMNINGDEFIAVLDDIVDAMDSSGIGEPERTEVLGILYGMKGEIVRL